MIDSTPIVREATQDDVEQLAPLFVKSVDTSLPGVTFSSDPSYTLDKVVPHLRARLFPPKAYKTYVLELPTGELAGYGSVKPGGGPNGDGNEVDMFFVRADLGRRGYGGQLMRTIQAEWGERGLWLRVFKENSRAIGFYEKWGFGLVEGQEETLGLSLAEPREAIACLMRWPRSTQ